MSDKWGKRFFKSAAIVIVLLGLVHSLAIFQKPVANNDTERRLLDLMANYKFPLPGAVRSTADLLLGFNIAFSLMSLGMGAVNLAISGQAPALLKRLALVNIIWLAAMTANSMYHWFAFPTAFLVTSLVLFVAAWASLPGAPKSSV